MSSRDRVFAGVAILAIAAIFYAVTDRTAATSVVFALILLAGFGLIAQALLRS